MGIVNAALKKPEAPEEQAQDATGAPEDVGADLSQDTAAPAAADTSAPEAGGTSPEGADDNSVSPEEQAQYDTFVTMALHAIYGKDQFPVVLMKLGSGKSDPGQAIGHTAAMVIRAVKTGIEQQGKPVPNDIVFASWEEVIDNLLQIAIGSNIIKKEDAQTVGDEATKAGMQAYGQAMQNAGEITPEMQAQAKQDLADNGHPVPGAPPPAAAQPTAQAAPQPAPAGGIVNQAGA